MTNKQTAKPKPWTYSKKFEAPQTDKAGPCVCCGKRVPSAGPYFVHVVGGGSDYGGEDDTGDGGDMGWFAVGPACAKKLRAAGVHVAKL